MLFNKLNKLPNHEIYKRKDLIRASCRSATSIFDFTVKDTFDNDVCLDRYRGYVVLIVNIASNSSQTLLNYAELMELKRKYHDAGLRILCFPCNQFAQGMPENDGEQILNHFRWTHANFDDVVFKKVHVNGDYADPLFVYLKSKKRGVFGKGIRWNFTKFLIDRNGIPVARFSLTTLPTTFSVQIENLLL